MTTTDNDLGRRLVEAILEDFPDHQKTPPLRPIHTWGMGAKGVFRASLDAPGFCNAEHFRGDGIQVSVRFSNGLGGPKEDDNDRTPHGLAVKFHLADGASTDLIGMTLGCFFVRDADEFLSFTAAAQPKDGYRRPGWLKRKVALLKLKPRMDDLDPPPADGRSNVHGMLKFANDHRYARPGIVANGSVYRPASWTRAKYHVVHAFGMVGRDGNIRHGRLRWEPITGIHPLAPGEKIGPQGLRGELQHRLERGPVQFQLRVALAEAGDPLDDPTTGWPEWREKVTMGTLTLNEPLPDDETEKLSFNPMRLVEQIKPPPGDKLLEARRVAYNASAERRNADFCPVAHQPGQEDR